MANKLHHCSDRRVLWQTVETDKQYEQLYDSVSRTCVS